MEQEQQFLAALESAAVFSVENDLLEMRTAEGSLVVEAIPDAPLPPDVQESVENMAYVNTAAGDVILSGGLYTEPIPNSAASIQTFFVGTGRFWSDGWSANGRCRSGAPHWRDRNLHRFGGRHI